jgi:hypothetical protein
VALRLFVETNGYSWEPYPRVDDAEAAVLAVASGRWTQEEMAKWLGGHLIGPPAKS